MEAVTSTISLGYPTSCQPRMIRSCGVPLDTVESAVLSRRVGSANAARLQSSAGRTSSLAAAKAVAPAARYAASADVIRRREQVHALSEAAVTVVRSNFKTATSLTQLGIDLEAPRPQTAKAASSTKPKATRPASSSYDLVRKTVSVQQALHAVNSVLPHVLENTPYLQHLRDRAHQHVIDQAENIGVPTGQAAEPTFAELMDMIMETNQQQLFSEWNSFIGQCDKSWFESLPEPDRQELFAKFVRRRGRVVPHNPPAVADETAQKMLLADVAAVGEALDDLAAPSGAPAILPPIKLMMHASSKRAFHDHLVQQQQQQLHSPQPQPNDDVKRPTPARLASARQERFEERKLVIQQDAQRVFTSTVEAQRRHQRDFALRTAINHAAHNLRLHQRGNVSTGHNAAVCGTAASSADQRLRTPSPAGGLLDIAAVKRSSPVV